jgi:hypothetical protein
MDITRNNALQGMFGRPEAGPRIKLEVDAVAACHTSGKVTNRADSALRYTPRLNNHLFILGLTLAPRVFLPFRVNITAADHVEI